MPKKKKDTIFDKKKITKTDVIEKINELRTEAQNCLVREDMEMAIETADKIIKLAVLADIPEIIQEQQDFINVFAERLQKKHMINLIATTCEGLRMQYEKLIDSGRMDIAHTIIENFKKEYENISYFKTVPCVNELLIKDSKYSIKDKGKEKKESDDEDKEDYDKILNKILRSI